MRAKNNPDKEYKYFLFDPLGDGFVFYKSAKDRDDDAQDTIDSYLDETWDEAVEQVWTGEITGICKQVNREDRPNDIDEEGYSNDGEWWPDNIDYRCSYALTPILEVSGDE